MPVGVVLANDSELVIAGLRALLEPFSDRVKVLGSATGDPDIAAVPQRGSKVDVVLLDTFARREVGLDAAAMVLSQGPDFHIVVFTDCADERHVLKALRLGVHGYLLKSAPATEVVETVERVAAGEVVLSSELVSSATRYASMDGVDEPWPGARMGLTRRESEVLVLIAGGKSVDDVATKLSVARETVRSHLKHVYQKLGVNDRTAAAAVAWQEGIVERDELVR